jgi:DNA-binding transcriptional ArsR family regulator
MATWWPCRDYHNDMDTYSLNQAARALGTTAPRVRRALDRLGIAPEREQGGRGAFRITGAQLARLREHLDVSPAVPGLSPVEARVLAAVARSPLGLASNRAVARAAGVSPTAASVALRRLGSLGLVRTEVETLALGKATRVGVLHAEIGSEEWPEVAEAIRSVRLPGLPSPRPARRVPPYLRHLFWNTHPRQLEVATSAPYIARRLLSNGDLEGLAWGAGHLPAEAWEEAAKARGLDPRTRALALNLARSARAAA